jgi:hypothetical protein
MLGISELVRAGLFCSPVATSCTITWPEMVGSEQVGVEGALYRWSEDEWSLILRHSFAHSSLPEPLDLPLTIRITRTPCYFGGWRYWLRCPQVHDGRLICRRGVTTPPNNL